MSELQSHDLLGMDRANDTIIYAYPLTSRQTEHRVELRDHKLNALCAIDALGVGSLYHSDVKVTSSCGHCKTPIVIEIAQGGKSLSDARPTGAVVWYDLAYSQTAASSCCPSIGFFCCDDHLQRWLDSKIPRREGHRLTLDEATEVGRAIFEPILASASAG